MKTILLLSHSRDFFTIDRVAEALEAAKIRAIRFNTDCYPESIRLSERVDNSGASVLMHTESQSFHSREINAVWLRKIWTPKIQSPMEEKYRQASVKESIAVRTAFFQSLGAIPWLDPIPAVTQANDKYFQLRCAQKVGFPIPQTIISNDAAEVLAFAKTLSGEMVGKLHTPLSFGMGRSDFFLFTTKIKAEDLDDLDMLQVCPMIFQEYIPKAYELRVAYVDGQCFTGKIQTPEITDWRQSKPSDVSWEPYELPQAQQELLRHLMQKLQLHFGAIDLIVQADGRYVFLEVNPLGEWGMLEKDLDLPISSAIARGLIKRIS